MISFSNTDLFLITGGSGGLGSAIASKIISLGGRVLAIGRNEAKLQNSRQMLGDNFCYEIKDLAEDYEHLPDWLCEMSSKYGKFKGIALAAGIEDTKPIAAIKRYKLLELFDVNFFANVFLIKGFAKKQVRIDDMTSCVFISSMLSELGAAGVSSYASSKAALNSIVRTSAIELAKNRIRVNAVLPGHIETELLAGSKYLSSEQIEKIKSKYPLGMGRPDDVANLTCFLLSDAARWITGANYAIDGGAGINF